MTVIADLNNKAQSLSHEGCCSYDRRDSTASQRDISGF